LVGQVRLVAQFRTDVVVDGRGVGAGDGPHARVLPGVGFLGPRRLGGEPSVDAPDQQTVVAQQLGGELHVVPAQVGAADEGLGQGGQLGEVAHDGVVLALGQPAAQVQGQDVVAGGVVLGVADDLGEGAVAVAAVVVGDGRVGGQVQRVGGVAA